MPRPWCVRDIDGVWCQAANQRTKPDAWISVKTACDSWIICPVGIERRRPTCAECRARLTQGKD